MSGSITPSTTAAPVAPLITKAIGFYRKIDLYDPDNPPASANDTNRIVPVPESVVIDGNVLYTVESVDPTTFKSTLVPIILSDETDGYGLASVISYGNDIFRAYYDVRTQPYRMTIDRRLIVFGGAPSFYQLIRYPDTDNELVISRYYSTTGVYTSNQIPMLPIPGETNTWWCQPCQVIDLPSDNEELTLRVYNETGALIASVKLFAKQSSVVNDTFLYQPKIVDLQISSPQMLADGSCYLYEKQSPDSLEITGVLVYNDGTKRSIMVDNAQTFIYGIDDLLASYAGLRQNVLLKYFLAYNEVLDVSASNTDVQVTDASISREVTVKIIPNKLSTPVKVSVIPEWNSATSTYMLRYYLYSTDHSSAHDVTAYTSITSGSYDGGNFMGTQSFTFSLDLNNVDATKWPQSTTYAQTCAIKLLPFSVLEKYTLRDSVSSPYIYGQDNSSSRRPLIAFDSTIGQYFIPSSIFLTKESVIQSFYTNANPPFNSDIETSPPTPTHFLVRDAFSGVMLTAQLIPLDNYTEAFNLTNGASGNFTKVTVVVEFVQVLATGTNILYGVPVDVTTGTYIGTQG